MVVLSTDSRTTTGNNMNLICSYQSSSLSFSFPYFISVDKSLKAACRKTTVSSHYFQLWLSLEIHPCGMQCLESVQGLQLLASCLEEPRTLVAHSFVPFLIQGLLCFCRLTSLPGGGWSLCQSCEFLLMSLGRIFCRDLQQLDFRLIIIDYCVW